VEGIIMNRRVFGVAIVFLFFPLLLSAQQKMNSIENISKACMENEFRQFDFWLGQWAVHDTIGSQIGSSRISRVADGCGIREEWTGANGNTGTSLNYYDKMDKKWHQDWVGGGGLILHLNGNKDNKTMILSGKRIGRQGPVVDRISWTELQDGKVRQQWDVSTDDGKTWKKVFVGLYNSVSNK
jgi:hypothetical protein